MTKKITVDEFYAVSQKIDTVKKIESVLQLYGHYHATEFKIINKIGDVATTLREKLEGSCINLNDPQLLSIIDTFNKEIENFLIDKKKELIKTLDETYNVVVEDINP